MTPEINQTRNITILNGTDGMTNCIESDVIRRDLAKVTNEIFGKLKDHYGPYSLFAGIDPNKPLEDTVFTKDGANIVRSLSYIAPQEDWARKIVAYIGDNIENTAGDGTTSSMMFACGMLKHMYNTINAIKPVSYNQLKTCYAEFIKRVKERMAPYILKACDGSGKYSAEQVYNLAYSQAYTSSHGNSTLSEAAAKLFSTTPSELWDHIGFQRRRYESDTDIELVTSKAQYSMECKPMTRAVFNTRLKSALEYKNATLIVVNDGLGVDNPFWRKIEDAIMASSVEKPVAIIAHNDGDGITFQRLMELSQECDTDGNPSHCFCVFSTGSSPQHPTTNDFVALQCICGFNVIAYNDQLSRPAIKEGVDVTFDRERLTLDKLYAEPEGYEGVYRPQYFDQTVPYFRVIADGILENIKALKSGTMTPQDQAREREYSRILRKLVCRHQVDLVIGGKIYDNLAMFDVVDDVLRACKASLKEGAVVSNNKTLFNALSDLRGSIVIHKVDESSYATRWNNRKEMIIKWFADNALSTLSEFSDVVFDMLYPNGMPDRTAKKSFFGKLFSKKKDANLDRKHFRGWWFDNAVDLLRYNSNRTPWEQTEDCAYPMRNIIRHSKDMPKSLSLILQPANADIVLLERFGEVALKFVLTERLIVHNAAYVNKKGK